MPTPNELKALTFIAGYRHVHGSPPSLPDVQAALGLKSKSTTWLLLVDLQRQGIVVRTPGTARTLRLATVRRGGVSVPLVTVGGAEGEVSRDTQ